MQILLATTNQGKATEIAEALHGLPVELHTLDSLSLSLEPPEEDGATYADNALIKARHAHTATGLPTIADDSGIVVDALHGELGIHTRRWGAGSQASDAEWITHFLDRMASESDKSARFLCAIAFIDAAGNEHVFEGVCAGEITETLEADYLPGLPISACFRPENFSSVFSALPIEQKNSTSHRGRAMAALRAHLASQ